MFIMLFFTLTDAHSFAEFGHYALIFAAFVLGFIGNIVPRESPQLLDDCDDLLESIFSIILLTSEFSLWVNIFINLFGQFSFFCLQGLNDLQENLLGDDLISGLEGHG